MSPQRIQLRRTKDWRMPPDTVKVDRTTPYGNPFDWRDWLDTAPRENLPFVAERQVWAKQRAVQEFRDAIERGDIIMDLAPLRDLNLACWCSGPRFSCHADVLLEMANA